MNPVLRYLAVLPCALFILTGLRFAIDPAGAAGGLGMPLLDGVGRSTQIGDGGAFFLGGGLMVALGLFRQQKIWLLAPALLISLAVLFRTLATLFHGADFPASIVVLEVVLVALLYVSARAMPGSS